MSEFKILTFIEGEKGHVFSVENQKCLNLIRVGGGQLFSKMSEIQKSLIYPMGGGGGTLGSYLTLKNALIWKPFVRFKNSKG